MASEGNPVSRDPRLVELWKRIEDAERAGKSDEVNDLRRQAKALAQEIQSDRPSLKEKGNQGNSGR